MAEHRDWIGSSVTVLELFVPEPCATSQTGPGAAADWVSLVDRQLMGFESGPCKDACWVAATGFLLTAGSGYPSWHDERSMV